MGSATHDLVGSLLVLLVDVNIVLELVSEFVSQFDGVTNGLKSLKTTSLFGQRRVFAISINPPLCLQ